MSGYIVVFLGHIEAGFQWSGNYLLLADFVIPYLKLLGKITYGYNLFSFFFFFFGWLYNNTFSINAINVGHVM
jgi:tellurite resistance protein TehA-like permease